jgi:hypothetical protein
VDPLLYAVVGLIAGAAIAALTFFLARRGRPEESELARRLEMFDLAQQREEKMLRDEFSRNREESAGSAKAQREELAKSLEGVRAIVDLRLKEIQNDNAKQIVATALTALGQADQEFAASRA